ncbi:MAG TPA: hypothetical protein VEQ60_15825 [Longimicrobium sp.]|nr:hypothetical protein [Longimicrobium sp.]
MKLVEEIERLLRAAPPGTQLEVLRITVPERAETALFAPAPLAAEWSPAMVVEWVRQEHGEPGVKLKEWAGMLPGVSHRGLLRAADDGRLDWHPKPDGRDHGARMASPDAMLAFLAADGHIPQEPLGE